MSQTLAQKLLSVQSKIGAVSKTSSNPHFRSKYADLNEVLSVAKEALNAEGVFVLQTPNANEFGKYLETVLLDADSGQQVLGRVYFSGAEDNMQKIGAAITYARRFGLVSLLALESEDDDGEAAVGRGNYTNGPSQGGLGNRGPEAAKRSGVLGREVGQDERKVQKEDATPVLPKVSAGPSRKTVNEKISLTSKVLVDSKRATQDEVLTMLKAYAVDSKEQLNDEQAVKLLTQLETKLNG